MKPPPGPMFSFEAAPRPRPVQPARPLPTATAVARPRGNHRPRTVASALGLTVALVLAGAALLAPYAGVPAPTTAVHIPMVPTSAAP